MVDFDIANLRQIPELQPEHVVRARAVLIAGPTASGKSALALALADEVARLGRSPVIVNADSMQVYDGLHILTARPSVADEKRVPHRLYGHIAPQERYSAGRWLEDVAPFIAANERSGMPDDALPLLVGGSGLYFRALTVGLAEIPAVADAIVVQWQDRLRGEGVEALHALLAKRDKAGAAALSPTDPQRIIRALSVLEATGRSLGQWQADAGDPLVGGDETIRLAVIADRTALIERIGMRLAAMVDAGVLAEVEALVGRDLDPDLPVMKAIGVKEFAAFLDNRIPLETALEQASVRTRQYAKRQVTWIRNQMADWTIIKSG